MNEQSKKLLWVSICLRPLVSLPACFNFLPTEQAVKYALSLPPQCIISSFFFMYSHKIHTRSKKELYFIILIYSSELCTFSGFFFTFLSCIQHIKMWMNLLLAFFFYFAWLTVNNPKKPSNYKIHYIIFYISWLKWSIVVCHAVTGCNRKLTIKHPPNE